MGSGSPSVRKANPPSRTCCACSTSHSELLYEVTLPSTPSSLVFTADNQRLIVGGFQLKVLDAATGLILSEGDPKEREYAITQDGRFALSERSLRRARVIDLVDQKEVAVLQGNDFVSGASFSPDGRYVATWS